MYMVYIWWCLFCSLTENRSPRKKGPRCPCWAFPWNLKEPNNRKIATRTKSVVVGIFLFFLFQEKTSEIDLSQHIKVRFFISLTCFDNIHREKGACGHYNDKEKREHTDLLLCLTISTWKKAPAAAITTNKKQWNNEFIELVNSWIN